ncbi:helix-turn-helix transcriptional regulator [Vibrio navarrensis]|uniref:helix-turn-helix transcriptional regulator n=1 Tax=Vibrio navarrensis TaxID=29495 RepID=UPI0013022240|nr:WYL domain-containing protein [Vibrio navarrensis]EJL6400757.1 WYL domain-containing protein [Vibrio navarrensis]EJL6568162.1 WYL domain-containing protein [Vibrio navarrensis]
MKKKSSLNESLNLALEILKRIPKSRYITVKELKSQLAEVGIERDVRTLQRIMETLSEQFNLDRNDKSKPYGYKLTQTNAVLSLPTLSAQESLLFHLAREYLTGLLPSRVLAAMDGFFHEADYQLNLTSPNKKERNWLKKVRVVSETQPLLAPHLDEEVLRSISQGLYEDRWLSLEYTNSKDEPKKATVMPLGIAQQGNRLYLVCRFEGYTNERTLAIHRVTSAHLSTFTFNRPEDFDLAKYDADGRFGFGEGQQCRLQFCITKSDGYFLRETPLSPDQQVVERDDSLHISASVIDSLYLKKWLNSFGDNIWDIEIQPIASVS